jgi:hypothetical protein
MPTSRATGQSSPAAPKTLALNFDPRYVEFLIQTWLARDFAPSKLDDLIAAVARRADETLTELNAIGLHEESVSMDKVKSAVALMKTLGLLRQRRVTPKPLKQTKNGKLVEAEPAVALDAPYTEVALTSDGLDVFAHFSAAGGLRPTLMRQIVAKSPELTTLLQALRDQGPIVRPIRSLTVDATTRGAAYTHAVEEGLEAFWTRFGSAKSPSHAEETSVARTNRPTAAKLIENASTTALKRHPAGTLKQLDKLLALASELGLVWSDTIQINDVIAARLSGSAASVVDGEFAPNAPTWNDIRPRFLEALARAHGARADGTGFVSVEALRGALGHDLRLSAPVIDAFLCQARADGDQGRSTITLHFEPNEDVIYSRERRPLIWNGRAYDQVLATYPTSMRMASATSHLNRI